MRHSSRAPVTAIDNLGMREQLRTFRLRMTPRLELDCRVLRDRDANGGEVALGSQWVLFRGR
jgi:hypothetical protein